jgi:hypothetical protein
MSQSHLSSPGSAGLITRRSQVQILPPLLRKALQNKACCLLRSRRAAQLSIQFSTHFILESIGFALFRARTGSFTAFAPLPPAVARPGSSAPCAPLTSSASARCAFVRSGCSASSSRAGKPRGLTRLLRRLPPIRGAVLEQGHRAGQMYAEPWDRMNGFRNQAREKLREIEAMIQNELAQPGARRSARVPPRSSPTRRPAAAGTNSDARHSPSSGPCARSAAVASRRAAFP